MIDLTEILAQQTNGMNYDITTEDVVAKLQQWHSQYGIEIREVARDTVTVIFKQLPEDLGPLAQEIYEFSFARMSLTRALAVWMMRYQ